jgi:uncharacterized protein
MTAKYETLKILGIDLAGREENPTGICILDKQKVILKSLYTNDEIFEQINNIKPHLIVIDAPLSLPKGRCCLEKDCECAVGGHFRQSEREIRLYGRVLPLTFKGMKMLALRGISLASSLRGTYNVLEAHPRTTQKILNLQYPEKELNKYFKWGTTPSPHELDATLAALTGLLYHKNCHIALGNPEEGIIIIPKNMDCLKKIENQYQGEI